MFSYTKIMQGIQAVSAVVTDAYFNLVTLLLNTTTTNGAQNNSFLDSSSNNFSITRNGNTTQGTFTPFSQTGWSNYFDGTGDFLSVTANAAFNFGAPSGNTNDFTIEMWVYPTRSAFVNFENLYGTGGSGVQDQLNLSSAGVAGYFDGTTTVNSPALVLNQWNHVAVVRNGAGSNNLRVYANGVSGTAATSTNSLGSSVLTPRIGLRSDSLYPFQGNISNVRVVKGTAVYTANFTPSTTQLTAITNTSLLTCQSNRFVDNSTNAFAITRNGDVSVQAFSPFNPTAAYSTTTVGGSGYFDGTGDYLQNPASASNGLGTGNYTLECWFYLNSAPASGSDRTFIRYHWTGSTGQNAVYYLSVINSAGTLYPYTFARDVTTPSNNTTITSSTAIRLSTWNHVAAVRSGTTLTLYLNGVSVGSATGVSWNLTAGTNIPIYIGTYNGSSEMMDGYISGARVVKSAVYSGSTYTIPTAPPTSDVNTQLLLNYTNAGIYDATAKNDLETVGNAQVSTTQAKFGTTSMSFDGTGDYLTIPNGPIVAVGSGDFTIECWWYPTDLSASSSVWCLGDERTANNGLLLYWSSGSSKLVVYSNGASVITSSISTPINSWYYLSVVRSGSGANNLTLYINGSSAGTATNTTSFTGVANNGFAVCAEYAGSFVAGKAAYFDDVRITKGYARPSTTPTAAFPVQ